MQADILAGANWQRGGGKRRRPKPIPRPDANAKAKAVRTVERLRNLGLVTADTR